MPVSYLPCITPLLLIGIPLLCLLRGRKPFLIAMAVSILLVAIFLLSNYVPGWMLTAKANAGDPKAQYDLARWTENHSERIGAIVFWPSEPDVIGGFRWLEQAAAQDYPLAVWLVGVRLKYGLHVPRPRDWKGPAGNHFPQPERGQAMMDRAVNDLGYQPPLDEEGYYYHVFRR